MQQVNRRSLWDLTRAAGADTERFIADTTLHLPLAQLTEKASNTGAAADLRRKTVLVSSNRQMTRLWRCWRSTASHGASCFARPT